MQYFYDRIFDCDARTENEGLTVIAETITVDILQGLHEKYESLQKN